LSLFYIGCSSMGRLNIGQIKYSKHNQESADFAVCNSLLLKEASPAFQLIRNFRDYAEELEA